MRGAMLAFMLSVSCAAAETFKTRVEPLDGEKWWGAATTLGDIMPFPADTKSFDLLKNDFGNQASPLLLSSKGRYVWSEEPFSFKFEKGALVLESRFEKLSARGDGAGTLKSAFLSASKNHFPPDGKIPPEIFFSKPHFNTWIELVRNQNQADILKYARAIRENGFPCGVFMVDGGWDRYYGMLEFRADKFPDPAGLNAQLREMGYKVMYWTAPFAPSAGGEFLELQGDGVLLQGADEPKMKNGRRKAAIIPWWSGKSPVYDMTSPRARAHFSKRLKALAEKYGIDGFKFDGGAASSVSGKGILFDSPKYTPQDYPRGYSQLAFEFPYHEFKSTWKLGGRAIVQRLRDKHSTWDGLRQIIPHAAACGMLGYPYFAPDMVGGGEYKSFIGVEPGRIDQRLIVRFAQASALMPMMQFSLAPWRVLDKKHLDACRDAANLHVKFADYILKTAREASATGEPIVRAMEYEFPNCGYENIRDQFMLGSEYLVAPVVAPVVTPADSREVVLPRGEWIDELGNRYSGGRAVKIDAPIWRLPHFKKLHQK